MYGYFSAVSTRMSSTSPDARAVGTRTAGRACLVVLGDCQKIISRPRAWVITSWDLFSRARSSTRSMAGPRRLQDLTAHGNFVDHEYEIERDGDTVATISKKWFRVRDTYGVQIADGEDQAFLLAVTVCVDQMARD